jgi:hypothetical protein
MKLPHLAILVLLPAAAAAAEWYNDHDSHTTKTRTATGAEISVRGATKDPPGCVHITKMISGLTTQPDLYLIDRNMAAIQLPGETNLAIYTQLCLSAREAGVYEFISSSGERIRLKKYLAVRP